VLERGARGRARRVAPPARHHPRGDLDPEGPHGDQAVVHLEAEDLEQAFQGMATSEEPFDRWFRAYVLEVHGLDLAEGFPPPEQALDFRG